MKKLIIAAAAALMVTLSFGYAVALTIPAGHVITEGGEVVSAETTTTGQALIAQHGFLVVGQTVFVEIADGVTIALSVSELIGATRAHIIDVVGEAIGEQLTLEEIQGISSLAEVISDLEGSPEFNQLITEIATDLVNGTGTVAQLTEFETILATHCSQGRDTPGCQEAVDGFHEDNPGLS